MVRHLRKLIHLRLYLIPVRDALPAVQAYLDAPPGRLVALEPRGGSGLPGRRSFAMHAAGTRA